MQICPGTDENVEMFEELINQYNLTVINLEEQSPTFRGRAGADCNIDITMIQGDLYNNVQDW